MGRGHIAAVTCGCLAAGIAVANPVDDYVPPTLEVPRAPSEIKVDGVLDEPAWTGALRLALDYEVRPGENIKPPVATEVFLANSEAALYVAFRAHDPDPARILAHYTDRDEIYDDDWVVIILDTFNDQRRTYDFFANPLGIQGDQIEKEN